MLLVTGGQDRLRPLRQGKQRPEALVLGAQMLDLARGLIEPTPEVAFGHGHGGPRTLLPPSVSAGPR
jgi:hypothetical protein